LSSSERKKLKAWAPVYARPAPSEVNLTKGQCTDRLRRQAAMLARQVNRLTEFRIYESWVNPGGPKSDENRSPYV